MGDMKEKSSRKYKARKIRPLAKVAEDFTITNTFTIG